MKEDERKGEQVIEGNEKERATRRTGRERREEDERRRRKGRGGGRKSKWRKRERK
jgi:hypothetical protein